MTADTIYVMSEGKVAVTRRTREIGIRLLPAETAIVAGHAPALMPKFHFGGIHFRLHHTAHWRWNRIEVGQHACAATAVHRREVDRGQLESFRRQRQQMLPVQFFPTSDFRQRHQVIPPEISVLPFHPAFGEDRQLHNPIRRYRAVVVQVLLIAQVPSVRHIRLYLEIHEQEFSGLKQILLPPLERSTRSLVTIQAFGVSPASADQ